jgi:hypothetical protein
MCTVSFVPTGEGDFILTSNRDETVARGLASFPKKFNRDGQTIICPVDPLASGSWIAISENGNLRCLLNGAFQKHSHHPPYRLSRGIVVLDSLSFDDPHEFSKKYDLDDIEPFTMVMVRNEKEPIIFELRWDGKEKYLRSLSAADVLLWSSATLYTGEVAAAKEKAFKNYLEELTVLTAENLVEIHSHFLYEDWIQGAERVSVVSTLSITSVESKDSRMQMNYRDLVRKHLPLSTITFGPEG